MKISKLLQCVFSVWNSNLLSVISQHACHSLQILKLVKLWNQDLVVWWTLISCESFQNGQSGAGQSSWVPRPARAWWRAVPGNQMQEWMTGSPPGHGAVPALCSLSVHAKHLTLLSMSLKRLASAWPRPFSSVDFRRMTFRRDIKLLTGLWRYGHTCHSPPDTWPSPLHSSAFTSLWFHHTPAGWASSQKPPGCLSRASVRGSTLTETAHPGQTP